MISDREQAVLNNPERMASLRRGIQQSQEGKVTEYPPDYWSTLYEELDAEDPEDD